MGAHNWTLDISREARQAPSSGIAEVMKEGFSRSGIIPLWVGEGDLPTPRIVTDAAITSLRAGETFYMPQPGIPELRASLATYHNRLFGSLFGSAFEEGRFFVTGSGMQAIQVAIRLVAGAGEEILVPTPAWPNFPAAVGISGARAVEVAQRFAPFGWQLDISDLERATGPATRALFLNSPSNPTGWTASADDLIALLAFARRRGLWIIADEVYGRFALGTVEGPLPSLHAIIERDDKVIFVNTFSKNWAMTGWRLGWIEAPRELARPIENLVQYSTSGAPVFVQRGGVAALEHGEEFFRMMLARAESGRQIVTTLFDQVPQIVFAPPGGFYLFFRIHGISQSTAAASQILRSTGVGLAPGSAFGAAGEGFFRLCFARDHEDLRLASERIAAWAAEPIHFDGRVSAT